MPGQDGLENQDPRKMINHKKKRCKMKGSGCCSGSAWEGVCDVTHCLLPLLGPGSDGWAAWCQLVLAQGMASLTMAEQHFT